MAFDTTLGLDFFSTVLESDLYSGESSSEIVVTSEDLENLDSLGTGSFAENIFLIIGNDVDTRETVKATFTKTVSGDTVTRVLRLAEAISNNHNSGEEVYCGTTYRYLEEIKSILDEIDSIVDSHTSSLETLIDSVENNTDGIENNATDIADLEENVTNLQKVTLQVDLSDGDLSELEEGDDIYLSDLSITVTPLIYEVPANCGHLHFILPRNDEEEDQKYILLDCSNLSPSNLIVMQESDYDPAAGSYKHKIVTPNQNYSPKEVMYNTLTSLLSGSLYEYIVLVCVNDPDIGQVTVGPLAFVDGYHLLP